MSLYIVTRHVGRDGVNLSKPGHWGGLHFDDEAAAEHAARLDAGADNPLTIERETVTKRLPRVSAS